MSPQFSGYNKTSHRSWLLCACFLTTQVVEPGGAARQARRRRRPKWVDVLGHTQHGNLRLFVLLLPWEHLLASASSKTQTAALFACKKSERGECGGCGIDGNVAVSAAVTGAARRQRRAKSSPAPTRRSYDAVGNHFEGENLAHSKT